MSHVLKAMTLKPEAAMGTIRFSIGKETSEEEILTAVDEIKRVIKRLKPDKDSVPDSNANPDIKLTDYTTGLGCACKMNRKFLREILNRLPVSNDPNVVAGFDHSEDAAVYKISGDTSVVQTIDFFTPIVDDPFDYGAITAANSLSDIYSMGARPIFALSIAAFPSNRLPMTVMHDIMKGINAKAAEAGISILGGHTIDDNEPKFGLAVTGLIKTAETVRNSGSKVGDQLILTKPIGTGIYSTALKLGLLSHDEEGELVRLMSELNRTASEEMMRIGVNACTDVTGFGLVGHLHEMTESADLSAEINFNLLPLLPGLARLVRGGAVPGGSNSNFESSIDFAVYDKELTKTERIICCDAQTSGGLLIAVDKEKASRLISRLKELGLKHAALIGRMVNRGESEIVVHP
jgi:selenium donor protein